LNDLFVQDFVTIGVPVAKDSAGLIFPDGKTPDGFLLIPFEGNRSLTGDVRAVCSTAHSYIDLAVLAVIKQRPCHQVIIATGIVGKIPTIRTNCQIHPDRVSIHSIHRRTRQLAPTALRRIDRQLSLPVEIGAFNVRSVFSRGNSETISTWITERKLLVAGLTET